MKEKILALLLAQFVGVRKDGLMQLARSLALQCTTEEEAKALVEKLTNAQVKEFVKEFRADVDKEVSDGNKTYEANLKKKFDFVERKDPDTIPGGGGDPTKPQEGTTEAIVAAAVAKALEPFTKTMNAFNAKTINDARLQQLNEKLANCKNETFKQRILKDFARMSFDTDESFAEYLSETETDIATANQNVADEGLKNQGSPLFAQKDESGVSAAVQSFVKSQTPEGNTLAGKEL